jgi:hypothetical protein
MYRLDDLNIPYYDIPPDPASRPPVPACPPLPAELKVRQMTDVSAPARRLP